MENNTNETITKSDNLSDIKNLLNIFENTKLFSMIMNIILVKYGGRYATLIEKNNFSKTEQDTFSKILDVIIKNLNLSKTQDFVSYRYYVTKTKITTPKNQSEIAKLLGFYCKNHDFSNTSIKRISLDILEVNTNDQIYVEVGEYPFEPEEKFDLWSNSHWIL